MELSAPINRSYMGIFSISLDLLLSNVLKTMFVLITSILTNFNCIGQHSRDILKNMHCYIQQWAREILAHVIHSEKHVG